MVTSIIFSKNRPLQLDLCLKSIKENFKLCTNIIVIYKAEEEYKSAYEILKTEYSNVNFWDQKRFLNDIHCAIQSSENKYIIFFTDDCFCYKHSNLNKLDLEELMQRIEITCFSLRLGLNINSRSHENKSFDDKPIIIYEYKDYIIIPKTAHLYGSYWSYSLSVDGHIFRKQEIADMVKELIHIKCLYSWNDTPNDFESALQRFWTTTPNFIAADRTSSVVNSPNNRVQNSCNNRHGDIYSYTSKDLLNKFLENKRIDLSSLNVDNINCPHMEIDILRCLK